MEGPLLTGPTMSSICIYKHINLESTEVGACTKVGSEKHTRGVVASLTIRKTNRGREVKFSVSTKVSYSPA